MSREKTRDKLVELIEPLIESKGFELVRLDYAPGRQGRLNLYIDCDDGVNIDHCEMISKAVSALLDDHDPIDHAFILEVSSPGIERPLTKKKHFQRFEGEKVKIKTEKEIKGRKSFSGTLAGTKENSIVIELEDDSIIEIPLSSVSRANLWYPKQDKNNLLKDR